MILNELKERIGEEGVRHWLYEVASWALIVMVFWLANFTLPRSLLLGFLVYLAIVAHDLAAFGEGWQEEPEPQPRVKGKRK
jgi:hypothetical protein